MNPSSSGWITKQMALLKNRPNIMDISTCYEKLRESGFIYGISLDVINKQIEPLHAWTPYEKAKVNLFDALYNIYINHNANGEQFCETALSFYGHLNNTGQKKSSTIKQQESALEKILQERLQTNMSSFKKNFSNILINALLYIDVLAFNQYCTNLAQPKTYASALECTIINLVWLAIDQKQIKGSYDAALRELFEKSLRYTKTNDNPIHDIINLSLEQYSSPLEKQYIIDLVCVVMWDDEEVDPGETSLLNDLELQLQAPAGETQRALGQLVDFMKAHREEISYLEYSNPIKNFYDQTSSTVKTLILRNKKRLVQELSESKDLVLLLGKSTYKNLNKAEKKRVRSQLLDICKTVPSLAIFLLPGGSLLLPLLIRFIPELLPTAFDENRLEKEEIDQ